MPKRIGLVELYTHSEVLNVFCKLLLDTKYDLSVFTTDEIKNDLYEIIETTNTIQWYTKEWSQSRATFIELQKEALNHCDLLIFITLVSDYRFFSSATFKAKTILVIHNGHSYFRPLQYLYVSKPWIKGMYRLFRFYYMRKARRRNGLLNNFEHYSFASSTMSNYMLNNIILPEEAPKVISTLPFAYFENLPLPPAKNFLTIVIPGRVSNDCRDYQIVVEALSGVLSKTSARIRLILAGNAKGHYGQKIIKGFQNIAEDNFELLSFQESIVQKEFDQYLMQADFFILPLKKYRPFGTVKEKHGYSNISGSINDMIRFGVPTLLPATYPIEKDLVPLVEFFSSSDELENKLYNWVLKKSFLKQRMNAEITLIPYSKEAIQRKLLGILDSIV